jgi:hypothetical protein
MIYNVQVYFLLTYGKHMHYRIISLKGEVGTIDLDKPRQEGRLGP